MPGPMDEMEKMLEAPDLFTNMKVYAQRLKKEIAAINARLVEMNTTKDALVAKRAKMTQFLTDLKAKFPNVDT